MDMLSDKQSGDLSKKLLLIYQQLGYKSQIELLDTMNSVAARMDVVSVDLKISYMYLLITYASFLSVVDKISLVHGGLYDEKTSDHLSGLTNKALSSMMIVSNTYKSKALHTIQFCDDINKVHNLMAEIESFVREITNIVDLGMARANIARQ
jgi:hypothetical protein